MACKQFVRAEDSNGLINQGPLASGLNSFLDSQGGVDGAGLGGACTEIRVTTSIAGASPKLSEVVGPNVGIALLSTGVPHYAPRVAGHTRPSTPNTARALACGALKYGLVLLPALGPTAGSPAADAAGRQGCARRA